MPAGANLPRCRTRQLQRSLYRRAAQGAAPKARVTQKSSGNHPASLRREELAGASAWRDTERFDRDGWAVQARAAAQARGAATQRLVQILWAVQARGRRTWAGATGRLFPSAFDTSSSALWRYNALAKLQGSLIRAPGAARRNP